MISRPIIVGASLGLHARPAACFAQAVADAGLEATLTSAKGSADAQSALEIIALGVGGGEEVTLSTQDDTAEHALDALVALLASDLDA